MENSITTNHNVDEGFGESIHDELQKENVKVGDTITFRHSNQGVKKYNVIEEDGKKGVKLISETTGDDYDYESSQINGGKRRRRRRKSSKRKTHKRKGGKRRTRRRMRK